MQGIDNSSRVKIIILGLDNDIDVRDIKEMDEDLYRDHDLSIFVREAISLDQYDIEMVEVPAKSPKDSLLVELFKDRSLLDYGTVVIHDLASGNPLDDISRLLELKKREGTLFAIGFIKPVKTSSGIGCWAFDEGIVNSICQEEDFDIRVKILDLARSESLQLYKLDQC